MHISFNDDAMDLDEPIVRGADPLFLASLAGQSDEESIQTVKADPRLYELFRRSVVQRPSIEPIAEKLARISISLLPEAELPSWVTQFYEEPEPPSSLLEAVREGDADLIDQQRDLTPAQWLSFRDGSDNSLLHIAFQTGQLQLAIKLVERCPQFFLAVNKENQFALDILPKSLEHVEYLETLTTSYGMGKDSPSPVWRMVAPFCYLRDSFWIETLLKKWGWALKDLDPRQISEEPIHYHPLKICAQFGKPEIAKIILATCCENPKLRLMWACISGAGELDSGELVRDLAQELKKELVDGLPPFLYPPYISEHPAAQRLAHTPQYTESEHMTRAILLHHGILPLEAIQHPYNAWYIAPDSPYTETLFRRLCGGSPKAKIHFTYLWFILNSSSPLTPLGLSFFIRQLKESLNEETALVCPQPYMILRMVLLSQDRQLAQQVYDLFKQNWFSLLVKALSPPVDTAWFQELAEFGSLPADITPELKDLFWYTFEPSFTLLMWLRTKAQEQFEKSLSENSDIFLFCSQLQKNKLDLLAAHVDWKRRVVRNNREGTLRSHAFLLNSEYLLTLLSQTGEWEPQELKEMLDIAKTTKIDIQKFQKLLSLFRTPDREDLESFIQVILHSELELEALDPLLFVDLSHLSYRDFMKAPFPSSANFEWLFEHGVKKPDPEEAERHLGDVPALLRPWWIQSLAQGLNGTLEETPETALLQQIAKETWERIQKDKRFKKNKNKSFNFASNYQIRQKQGAEIEIQRKGEKTSFRTGVYTFDRLVSILEEDASFIQLKRQEITAPFSNLKVTVVPSKTALTEEYVQSVNTPVWLEKSAAGLTVHYMDPGPTYKQFYWNSSCMERVSQFILDHNRKIQEKIEALDALATRNPPWKCRWMPNSNPGLGKFISVGRKGETTSFVVSYEKMGKPFSTTAQFAGIISPEAAKMEMDKLTAYQELHCLGIDLFGDMAFHPTESEPLRKTVDFCTNSSGLALLKLKNSEILATRCDTSQNQLFLMPSSWSQNCEKARSLHVIREMVSGYLLNRDFLKTLRWPSENDRIIHVKPAPVALLHLVKILEQKKQSLAGNLEGFLTALQDHTLKGFMPFEKFEKEYQKLEIQLTQIQLALMDKPEALSQFVCELGEIAQFCAPKIASFVQFWYRPPFNKEEIWKYGIKQLIQTWKYGFEQLLQKAYERAVAETEETLANWVKETTPGITREIIHRVLIQEGFIFSEPATFPWLQFPDILFCFGGMLIPHLVEVLYAMQQEAQQSQDSDLKEIFFSAIRECFPALSHLPQIGDFSEQIAIFESEKEAELALELQAKGELEERRAELLQQYQTDWQCYQKGLKGVADLEAKRSAYSQQLQTLKRAESDLTSPPLQKRGKRTFSHLIASESESPLSQDALMVRRQQIGDEIKAAHQKLEILQRELDFLKTILEQARWGDLRPIFNLEEEIQKRERNRNEIEKMASHKIKEQIEGACIRLGLIELDTVSRRGLSLLLKTHGYLIPGKESEMQQRPVPETELEAPETESARRERQVAQIATQIRAALPPIPPTPEVDVDMFLNI